MRSLFIIASGLLLEGSFFAKRRVRMPDLDFALIGLAVPFEFSRATFCLHSATGTSVVLALAVTTDPEPNSSSCLGGFRFWRLVCDRAEAAGRLEHPPSYGRPYTEPNYTFEDAVHH